jgi:hypothetical protein
MAASAKLIDRRRLTEQMKAAVRGWPRASITR